MTLSTLSRRRWALWANDAAERAIKTFAQGVLASGLVLEGASLSAFASVEPWSIGAAAAVTSVLTSLASKQTGSPSSAKLNG